MKRVIALFDFDGTITKKDSLLEFIRYSKGNIAFYTGFALHAPLILGYLLNIVSNQYAKEVMLAYFFRNMPEEVFSRHCINFSTEILPGLIRPKAREEIKKLQAAGAEIVVVSASAENWLLPFCDQLSAKCVATKLMVTDNKITGKIAGLNCYGEEKVRRITERFDLSAFTSVYCYGDTPGDIAMLSLGNIRFYKPFR